MDTTPIEQSPNYISSGAVDSAIKEIKTLIGTEVSLLNTSIDTKLNASDLPKDLSAFSNDKTNYITINEIPNYYVTEKMLDDRKYLTAVPLNYITFEELASRNYLTVHQDISGKVNKSELSTIAFTGSWNDLADKPTVLNGADGAKGDPGEKGDPGKSAYSSWLDAGNNGTEADFVNSLKGADGKNGLNGDIPYIGENKN
jgi:hypothetical protein